MTEEFQRVKMNLKMVSQTAYASILINIFHATHVHLGDTEESRLIHMEEGRRDLQGVRYYNNI